MPNDSESFFTPEAQRRWDKIPKQLQERLLNNVWCGGCLGAVAMNLKSAEMKGDSLVLKGICKVCGKNVARVIEPQ